MVEHPTEFLSCYRVLDKGAEKYEADGWLKEDPVEANIQHRNNVASIYRHVAALTINPYATDSETGLLHAEHAACRLNMIITRIKRGLPV